MVFKAIGNLFKGVGNAFKNAGESIWHTVKGIGQGIVGAAADIFGAHETADKLYGQSKNSFKTAGSKFVKFAKSATIDTWRNVGDVTSSVVSGIPVIGQTLSAGAQVFYGGDIKEAKKEISAYGEGSYWLDQIPFYSAAEAFKNGNIPGGIVNTVADAAMIAVPVGGLVAATAGRAVGKSAVSSMTKSAATGAATGAGTAATGATAGVASSTGRNLIKKAVYGFQDEFVGAAQDAVISDGLSYGVRAVNPSPGVRTAADPLAAALLGPAIQGPVTNVIPQTAPAPTVNLPQSGNIVAAH